MRLRHPSLVVLAGIGGNSTRRFLPLDGADRSQHWMQSCLLQLQQLVYGARGLDAWISVRWAAGHAGGWAGRGGALHMPVTTCRSAR